MKLILCVIVLLLATPAMAENDHLQTIETRPGASVTFYYMKREGAKASVILLSGGLGGIKTKKGIPTSTNFLVRSRDLFAANGFNVAVFDKRDALSRGSSEHIEDLRRLAAFLKKDAQVPVWIVGTSMGTISAAALATTVTKDELSGIVLTSSVTNDDSGAVPFQNLKAILVPVLVVHHEFDECRKCDPREVSEILRRLKNSPIKKEVYVRGGSDPSGDPCQPMHRHGFIGMEKEVIDLISAWIKNPVQ